MKTHLGNESHRRRTVTLALAVTLIAALLGLSQCKMINDPVTSAEVRENSTFHRSKNSRCERRCENEYKRCKRAENKRHDRAVRECRELKKDKDDSGEYRACRRAEEELHDENLRACKAEKRACKAECDYREGSGSGGR